MLNGNFAKSLEIQLGCQAIHSVVLKKSEKEKSKLKESLSGALVFIKFDGVTRLRSHFLGISVQYYDEEHSYSKDVGFSRYCSQSHKFSFEENIVRHFEAVEH